MTFLTVLYTLLSDHYRQNGMMNEEQKRKAGERIMSLDTLPKDRVYALIKRRLEKYETEERNARHRQKEARDQHARIEFHEDQLIAHGKVLAATEILEDVAGYGRQV